MHSYTIIYARTTCLCIKQDSRWKISLHGAYQLEILNACSYPRVLGPAGDSTIEKFCAWVDERWLFLDHFHKSNNYLIITNRLR